MINKQPLTSDKVEVPVAWLKRLIELGENAEVKVWSSPLNQVRKDNSRLDLLKGYIKSAESFLKS